MTSKVISKEMFDSKIYLLPLQVNILKKLIKQGPMTRDQLCEVFGFKKHKVVYTYPIPHRNDVYPRRIGHRIVEQYDKRTTIYDNLVKLQKRKFIEQFSENNGKRGRPLVFWKIKESKETIQIINQIS